MSTNQEMFLQYFTKYGQYFTPSFNQMTENASEHYVKCRDGFNGTR